MRYWVVGGEYKDASFSELVPGKSEERQGPFATYEEAHKVWAARAWATVDDALMRFRVIGEAENAAEAAPKKEPGKRSKMSGRAA
jgi:hypothetical protein